MSRVLTVSFGDGDLAEQLFLLKVSALRNHDEPALWRLTEPIVELVVKTADRQGRWPSGYVTDSRLFDVPVDYVRDMPHLLCDEYVIYPFTPRRRQVATVAPQIGTLVLPRQRPSAHVGLH